MKTEVKDRKDEMKVKVDASCIGICNHPTSSPDWMIRGLHEN